MSNCITRQASPKWTELTNQNHENEHELHGLHVGLFYRFEQPFQQFAAPDKGKGEE